jgi:hypothetical protein
MSRTLMVAVAAGGLLAGLASSQVAVALPAAKAVATGTGSLVSDVRYGARRRVIIGDRFYRGFYGRPFIGYRAYYGAGYSEGCGWIRKRAQATGGRYWWARYEDCIANNY